MHRSEGVRPAQLTRPGLPTVGVTIDSVSWVMGPPQTVSLRRFKPAGNLSEESTWARSTGAALAIRGVPFAGVETRTASSEMAQPPKRRNRSKFRVRARRQHARSPQIDGLGSINCRHQRRTLTNPRDLGSKGFGVATNSGLKTVG